MTKFDTQNTCAHKTWSVLLPIVVNCTLAMSAEIKTRTTQLNRLIQSRECVSVYLAVWVCVCVCAFVGWYACIIKRERACINVIVRQNFSPLRTIICWQSYCRYRYTMCLSTLFGSLKFYFENSIMYHLNLWIYVRVFKWLCIQYDF